MVRKPSVYPRRNKVAEILGAEKLPVRYQGYEAKFAEWAESQGWSVTKRGWPDFICRRDGAVMAVEVKGGADEIRIEQSETMTDLRAAGLSVYVYHDGLGLQEWRGKGKGESIATLKDEVAGLHDLIRKMIALRDEMVPHATPRLKPEWSIEHELEEVIAHCTSHHSDRHQRDDTRMTLCSWIFYLRRHGGRSVADISRMTGEHTETVQKMWRSVWGVVERAKHRQYHTINGIERCDDCRSKTLPHRPKAA